MRQSQELHWQSRGNTCTHYILFDVYNWVFIVTSESYNSDHELASIYKTKDGKLLWSTVTFASKRSLLLITRAEYIICDGLFTTKTYSKLFEGGCFIRATQFDLVLWLDAYARILNIYAMNI